MTKQVKPFTGHPGFCLCDACVEDPQAESWNRPPRVLAPVDPWLAGHWDHRGRFHTGTGWASCCAGIREPSNAFPFSEWRHVHTSKHRRTWESENLTSVKDGTE